MSSVVSEPTKSSFYIILVSNLSHPSFLHTCVGKTSLAVCVTVSVILSILYISAVTVTVLASPGSSLVTVYVTVCLGPYTLSKTLELSLRAAASSVKNIAVQTIVTNMLTKHRAKMAATKSKQVSDLEDLLEELDVLPHSSSRSVLGDQNVGGVSRAEDA
jgi:hypothetical protein